MNKNIILTALAALMFTASPSGAASGPAGDGFPHDDLRVALRLKDKGMEGRSSFLFSGMAREAGKTDPEGYSVLSDIVTRTPGYVTVMEDFLYRNPQSSLASQMRYAHALNCFST